MTPKQAFRKLLKERSRVARIHKWLAKHPPELVPPCPWCDSPEGCYSDCPVGPWNMDP